MRHFQKECLGDGEPLRPRGGGRRVAHETKIYRHEGLVESVQVDDRRSGEGGEPSEIERTVINPSFAISIHQQRQTVGAADERAGLIHEAVVLSQKGAGVGGESCAGTFLKMSALSRRQIPECRCQGYALHGEERQMTAAAVTAVAAGDGGVKLFFNPLAELIHTGDELPVVFQPGVERG